ncbi:hypothetical protein SOPP22_05995 [Shewanella sp. OPT22]|nr:hypothetical protein SOPP22_05995 [Shewanella sp. OPT22]
MAKKIAHNTLPSDLHAIKTCAPESPPLDPNTGQLKSRRNSYHVRGDTLTTHAPAKYLTTSRVTKPRPPTENMPYTVSSQVTPKPALSPSSMLNLPCNQKRLTEILTFDFDEYSSADINLLIASSKTLSLSNIKSYISTLTPDMLNTPANGLYPIEAAYLAGNMALVDELIRFGAKPDILAISDLQNSLCSPDTIALYIHLCQQGVLRSKHILNLLYMNVPYSQIEPIINKYIHSQAFNVNGSIQGKTLMEHAFQTGRHQLVESLLTLGSSRHQPLSSGFNPLISAIKVNNIDLFNAVLKASNEKLTMNDVFQVMETKCETEFFRSLVNQLKSQLFSGDVTEEDKTKFWHPITSKACQMYRMDFIKELIEQDIPTQVIERSIGKLEDKLLSRNHSEVNEKPLLELVALPKRSLKPEMLKLLIKFNVSEDVLCDAVTKVVFTEMNTSTLQQELLKVAIKKGYTHLIQKAINLPLSSEQMPENTIKELLDIKPLTSPLILCLMKLSISPEQLEHRLKSHNAFSSSPLDLSIMAAGTTLIEHALENNLLDYLRVFVRDGHYVKGYKGFGSITAYLANQGNFTTLKEIFSWPEYPFCSNDIHIIIQHNLGAQLLFDVCAHRKKASDSKLQDEFHSFDMNCVIKDPKTTSKITTLERAYPHECLEYLAILLKFDIDLDVRSEGGNTLLHRAAKDSRIDVLKMLLPKAKSEGYNLAGKGLHCVEFICEDTPVHIACKAVNKEALSPMFAYITPATLQIKNLARETPLQILSHHLGYEPAMQYLSKLLMNSQRKLQAYESSEKLTELFTQETHKSLNQGLQQSQAEQTSAPSSSTRLTAQLEASYDALFGSTENAAVMQSLVQSQKQKAQQQRDLRVQVMKQQQEIEALKLRLQQYEQSEAQA